MCIACKGMIKISIGIFARVIAVIANDDIIVTAHRGHGHLNAAAAGLACLQENESMLVRNDHGLALLLSSRLPILSTLSKGWG